METILFELGGDYALFKKPYSPMSPVSYPFPPPTAVMGILGAIGGYAKEACAEALGWRSLRVAVRVLKPPRTFATALNLLNTKDGTDAFFRPRADQNIHIQVPCEFLQAVAYRIYVTGLNPAARERIVGELEAGRTQYTVTLGWASCLADVAWIGRGQTEALDLGDEEWHCDSVVPLHQATRILYEDERRYHRLRVPATMDDQRVVHRYQEVVMAEDGGPVRGRGGWDGLCRIGDEILAFL